MSSLEIELMRKKTQGNLVAVSARSALNTCTASQIHPPTPPIEQLINLPIREPRLGLAHLQLWAPGEQAAGLGRTRSAVAFQST